MPPLMNHQEPQDARASDAVVVDLLRKREALEIGELAEALGVTATAVRQRLERLTKAGFVERSTVSRPRGRPAHAYRLTDSGRKLGGNNFRDLALVLWREIRGVRDPAVRSGLLKRIGVALAGAYRDQVSGKSTADRLQSIANLLQERNICCSVEPAAGDPKLQVLTSHACPYPDLAEEDRGVCAAERLMLQDLLESDVRLAECRLDGGATCRFVVGERAESEADVGTCTPGS
jgi:predicted ArsR family transcriptional regulator